MKKLWLVMLITGAGCAPSAEAVRADAARVLACPAKDVEVRWQADLDYAAAGCGHTTYLRCAAKRDAECRVITDSTDRAGFQAGSVAGGALVNPAPPSNSWAELSLMVEGPARAPAVRACVDEARTAGVRLREEASAKATLYLGDDENRVSFADNRPTRPLGKWSSTAVCRAAIAAGISLQDRVRVSTVGAPANCRELGGVEAREEGQGLGVQPSYDAAVATLQFGAVRLGGNVLVVDAMRQVRNLLILNGRAFACGARRAPVASPVEKEI